LHSSRISSYDVNFESDFLPLFDFSIGVAFLPAAMVLFFLIVFLGQGKRW